MKKKKANPAGTATAKKIKTIEINSAKILRQFERFKDTYLGARTMKASEDTQNENAAVCRRYLIHTVAKFPKTFKIEQLNRDHYSDYIKTRRCQDASESRILKEYYVLNTFFEAAGLDIHINPPKPKSKNKTDEL